MGNEYDVNFNALPEKTFTELQNGIYILKIEDIIKEEDDEYGMKYTMTHDIVGTGRKVNYDNYKIFNAAGDPETFGQGKLRNLIIAVELQNLDQINVKVLKAVALGKMFKAEIKVKDNGYANINYANIFPLSDERPVLNPIEEEGPIVQSSKTEEPVSADVEQEFKDDDI